MTVPPPPAGPTYVNVNMAARDHVIVPRYRYEQLLRLETFLKIGYLVFKDGATLADEKAVTQEEAEASEPSPSISDEVRRVIFGPVPGYESFGPPASDDPEAPPDGVNSEEPGGADAP